MANLGKYLTPSKVKLESKGVASVRSRVINLTELVPTLSVAQMADAMVKAAEKVYGLEAERRFRRLTTTRRRSRSDTAVFKLRLELRQERSVLVCVRKALCVGRGDDPAGREKRMCEDAVYLTRWTQNLPRR